jgi:hypothetical protein
LQLRKIMAICALLQRMGIFGGGREKSVAVWAVPLGFLPSGTRSINRRILSIA